VRLNGKNNSGGTGKRKLLNIEQSRQTVRATKGPTRLGSGREWMSKASKKVGGRMKDFNGKKWGRRQ